jgi:hypothetical protein
VQRAERFQHLASKITIRAVLGGDEQRQLDWPLQAGREMLADRFEILFVKDSHMKHSFVVLDVSAVSPFVEQQGLTFPILLDRDGQASATYQANALPSSFFVDRNAVIRVVYRGPMPTRVIAGTIEQLLQERP